MPRSFAVLAVVLSALATSAAEPSARHGVAPDLKTFPQTTPKESLGSILRAIEQKRFDYLLAHLSDPEWVDSRAETAAEGFKAILQETRDKLDPPTVKRLQQFLEQGEIETLDASAVVRLKDVKDRVVRLRKLNNRWYLRNANRP